MNTNRIKSPDVKNAVRKMQKNLFNKQIIRYNSKKASVNPDTFTKNETLRQYIREKIPQLNEKIKKRKIMKKLQEKPAGRLNGVTVNNLQAQKKDAEQAKKNRKAKEKAKKQAAKAAKK